MPGAASGKAVAVVAAIAFLFGGGVPANASPPSIDAIAGVYKQTGSVTDHQSEDILEIVKLSPTTAYFRTHLEFSDYHICGIWGVMEKTEDDFVYRGPVAYSGNACVLHLKVAQSAIIFDDEEQACRSLTWRARGLYSSPAEPAVVYFDLNSRRRIRYMERLLASREYAEAIAEYEARLAGIPPKPRP